MNQYAAPQAHVADISNSSGVGELKLFSPQGRIGRLRYLAYGAGASVAYYIVMAMVVFGLASTGAGGNTINILIWVMFAVMMWFSIITGIKRCHDMDISGWWSLTLILPLIVFAWMFWPGSKAANRFGPPPPPNNWGVRILGLLMPLFFIIGILAAVAIPQYKDYTDRAKARAAQQQQQQPAGQQ